MSTLLILSKTEQEDFMMEPILSLTEKQYFFKVPEQLLINLNSSKNKLLMTLLWGYYKMTNRFYIEFRQESNIKFVANLYNYRYAFLDFPLTTIYRYRDEIKKIL